MKKMIGRERETQGKPVVVSDEMDKTRPYIYSRDVQALLRRMFSEGSDLSLRARGLLTGLDKRFAINYSRESIYLKAHVNKAIKHVINNIFNTSARLSAQLHAGQGELRGAALWDDDISFIQASAEVLDLLSKLAKAIDEDLNPRYEVPGSIPETDEARGGEDQTADSQKKKFTSSK